MAIERLFASTSRGAALVGRLKADPALMGIEISHRLARQRLFARLTPPGRRRRKRRRRRSGRAAPALDQRGTRRAPRTAIVEGAEILIDGGPARLVDLSALGAQVLSTAVLKPSQRVRVSMVDEKLTLRFQATIMWATFEMPRGGTARAIAPASCSQGPTPTASASTRRAIVAPSEVADRRGHTCHRPARTVKPVTDDADKPVADNADNTDLNGFGALVQPAVDQDGS